MRGSAICCELLITILETPEDGLAELHTPQPHCFKTAFPGSPNGFSSRPLRKTFARSSDLCIVQVPGNGCALRVDQAGGVRFSTEEALLLFMQVITSSQQIADHHRQLDPHFF